MSYPGYPPVGPGSGSNYPPTGVPDYAAPPPMAQGGPTGMMQPNIGFGTGMGPSGPGYPPNIPGPYPSSSPYPPVPQGMGAGYPPSTQGMGSMYPPAQGMGAGYPPSTQSMGVGYPSSTQGMGTGYPPSAQGMGVGYPPSTQGMGSGYPPSTQGIGSEYPPLTQGMGSGYPPSAPSMGFPSQTPGAPSMVPPPTAPTSVGYPPATQGMGYPTQGSTYPGAHSGYAASGSPYPGAPAPANDVPTVFPVQNFNPAGDAQTLRKAMKGMGTNEKAIIEVLAKRSGLQRFQIAQAYQGTFHRDLRHDLKSELGGKLEVVILAMIKPLPDYHADLAHQAVHGLGTKESTLIEIFCSARTNMEVGMIKAAYTNTYSRALETDLSSDTSSDFRNLIMALISGSRDENPNVNIAFAKEDAHKLYKAGEKKRFGTDEATFNMILSTRSYPHLKVVFQEYGQLSGHSFVDAVKRETSGDYEEALVTLVECINNKHLYFASRLRRAMAGMGTNDAMLIRIIVGRSEIDLGSIKMAFQREYGKSLESCVHHETSGDYKKILLAILS